MLWTPSARAFAEGRPDPRGRPTFTIDLPPMPAGADFDGPKTYIVRCNEFVKIGYTSGNLHNRLRSLLSSTPFDYEIIAVLPYGQPLERRLHKRFAEYHHRDEWFRLEGKLRRWIECGCTYKREVMGIEKRELVRRNRRELRKCP